MLLDKYLINVIKDKFLPIIFSYKVYEICRHNRAKRII